ncbi:MAG: hypothetical protein HKM98_03790 [Gammaproteobacteria bacterium]|nr:hypothetical protein [Gammaproteobacteria bacterium]
MPFETLVVRLLTDALSSIVNAARITSRRRRAATAISKAIRELFAQKPDFHVAEALVVEARQLLTKPTADLLRAEQMLTDVRLAEEKRQQRKVSQKKSARKKVRKKTTRKASRPGGAKKSPSASKKTRKKSSVRTKR